MHETSQSLLDSGYDLGKRTISLYRNSTVLCEIACVCISQGEMCLQFVAGACLQSSSTGSFECKKPWCSTVTDAMCRFRAGSGTEVLGHIRADLERHRGQPHRAAAWLRTRDSQLHQSLSHAVCSDPLVSRTTQRCDILVLTVGKICNWLHNHSMQLLYSCTACY